MGGMMIKSTRRLIKVRREVEELKGKIESGEYPSDQIERFRSRLEGLEADIAEYLMLLEKGPEGLSIKRPEDVLLLPVRYRIAKKMTLEAFSEMVGVGVRLIWRYEKDGYTTAKGHTLNRILSKLPVNIETEVREL